MIHPLIFRQIVVLTFFELFRRHRKKKARNKLVLWQRCNELKSEISNEAAPVIPVKTDQQDAVGQ